LTSPWSDYQRNKAVASAFQSRILVTGFHIDPDQNFSASKSLTEKELSEISQL
jgi:hypothetical protein